MTDYGWYGESKGDYEPPEPPSQWTREQVERELEILRNEHEDVKQLLHEAWVEDGYDAMQDYTDELQHIRHLIKYWQEYKESNQWTSK